MAPERLLSRAFGICFAANLTQGVAFNLYLHLPGFLGRLGAGEVQIGLIAGVGFAAAILARPPIGRSMDRSGRRRIIRLGGVLNVIACALYLGVGAIGPVIYAVRVVHGVGEAMLFTSLFTYAADLVPAARRTQGLALFGVSGIGTVALGGLLGDWILAHGGYRDLFVASVVLAGASLLLSLPLRDLPRAGDGEHGPPRGLGAALREPGLQPLWQLGFTFAVSISAFFVFIKVFVEQTGIGSVGLFFSCYTAAALVLRVGFGWLPDRVGPKRVLFPALGILGVGFGLMARADAAHDVALAGLACGLGHGYTFPILFGMVVGRARDSERGAAMAVFTALFDAGALVGGPLFGGVLRAFGFAWMFTAGGALLLTGAVTFAAWDRGRS